MLIAGLIPFLTAMLVSLAVTAVARGTARRLGLMDQPGNRKVHTVPTPRNGGLGIFAGIALPMLVGILVALAVPIQPRIPGNGLLNWFYLHQPGLQHDVPLALLLLATTLGIHLLGLLDDRKPLPPWPKLLGQLALAAALVLGGEMFEHGGFRVVTLLDTTIPGGLYLSAAISILWIAALTNAFNFLDNMDGLSAGVAFICALMFLIAAILSQQWFICGLLLLFMGSVLGFLCYNFPPASIFMGDGGSMVLGFFLSALTIRTTYYHAGESHPYAVLMPLIVMAVPLYDLVIVTVLRIAKGRSPLSGDTNHFSHRLVRHGFSKRGAVLVIYAITAAMGLSAPLLTRVDSLGASLIGLQCAAMLVVIGILERVGEHTT